MQTQLKQCFALMAKIKDKYPEGTFDREMIHGDMEFRYRQLSEMRAKLEDFLPVVYAFVKFKNALKADDKIVKTFFMSVIRDPEKYSAMVGLNFQERRKKLTAWSEELSVPTGSIDELLTRCRLSGILDAEYKLNKDNHDVIAAYLTL